MDSNLDQFSPEFRIDVEELTNGEHALGIQIGAFLAWMMQNKKKLPTTQEGMNVLVSHYIEYDRQQLREYLEKKLGKKIWNKPSKKKRVKTNGAV